MRTRTREGGSGDGRREGKREEEREGKQSLRSKGGRSGENSGQNKGSLSLYLAAFRVAFLGGGIIRGRSTFFLLTRDRHGDKKSVEEEGVTVANISICSPLPYRFGDWLWILSKI
jgi:hypothetical protein